MVKPKIIAKPYKDALVGTDGKTRKVWIIPTNIGELTVEQCAGICGQLTPGSFIRRVEILGWEDPDCFSPADKGGWSKKARERSARQRLGLDEDEELMRIPPQDWGKYAHLSDKPRAHRLRHIKPAGTWERKLKSKRLGPLQGRGNIGWISRS